MKNKIYLYFFCVLYLTYPTCAKSFVVGELTGQLGNQLFVVAATVSLALDHGVTPIFPDLISKKNDNIPLNFKKIFYRLNTKIPHKQRITYFYREPHFNYAAIPFKNKMCISGYFQSERYFVHHKNEILALFAPHPEITKYLQHKYGNLLKNSNTVSLHLRSYVGHDPNQILFPQYGKDYFAKAISLFPQDSIFIVFSNDMKLCKKELESIPANFIFIENEAYYHDFYLMSLCKHNIICNSSFSWWAAYLNQNPNKIVVAPRQWFTKNSGVNFSDVIPSGWITID